LNSFRQAVHTPIAGVVESHLVTRNLRFAIRGLSRFFEGFLRIRMHSDVSVLFCSRGTNSLSERF
jgi:hypothetical protein